MDQRVAFIADLVRDDPRWGPKKLRTMLQKRRPDAAWPAVSTMGDLLRHVGLSQPQRRARYTVPLT